MDQPPRLCRVAGRDTWHIYHKRRRISTGCTDRTQAERVLAEFLAGGSRPSAGTPVSVADTLAYYLADRIDRGKPGAERLRWAHKPLARHLGTTASGTNHPRRMLLLLPPQGGRRRLRGNLRGRNCKPCVRHCAGA
jgi:hypothetical protein